MIINNKFSIKRYNLDTDETIRNKIAVVMNQLPEYLLFPDFEQEEKLEVVDMTIDLNSTDDILKYPDYKKVLFRYWLSTTKSPLLATQLVRQQLIPTYIESGFIDSEEEFNKIFDNRNSFEREYNIKLTTLKNKVSSLEEKYKKFSSVEGIPFFGPFPAEIEFSFIIEVKLNTLLELFNNIETSELYPFIACEDYYKIFRSTDFDKNWLSKIEPDCLLIQANIGKEYTKMIVKLVDNRFVCQTSLTTKKNIINQQIFLDRAKKLFNSGITRITENSVTSNIIYPQAQFNSFILSDYLMNDRFISQILFSNESSVATKRKGSKDPWLYLFTNNNNHLISASVINRSFNKGDNEHNLNIGHNELYINVRVKGVVSEDCSYFARMFGQVLKMYDEASIELFNIYLQYCPDIDVQLDTSNRELKKTALLNSSVYVSNATRMCPINRLPERVEEDNIGSYPANKIMKFPRDAKDYTVKYPSDGVNQLYYTCPHVEHPYIGLKVNTLQKNSAEYPYIPCCFAKDQTEPNNKNYQQYFNDKVIVKQSRQQNIILTDKILDENVTGNIPPRLNRILKLNDNRTYLRCGVKRNVYSFLSCCIYVSPTKKSVEQIYKYISQHYNLARQHLYELSDQQLQKKLTDKSLYIDPKETMQLVEEYFDLNVILFNSNGLCLPYFTQNYYQTKNKNKYILVYEHYGSESDNAKYPQCELIIRWNSNKPNDLVYIFDPSEPIIKLLTGMYDQMMFCYCLSKPVYAVDRFDFVVKAQQVDYYGKCRRIDIEHNEDMVTILTEPIQPFGVEQTDKQVYSVSVQVALSLLQSVQYQSIKSGVLMELTGYINNILVHIPVSGQQVDNIPINKIIHYNPNSSSSLSVFNFNKKMSRYISEYLYWLFSNYIKDADLIDDTILAKFAKERIIIVPEHQYKQLPNNLSYNSPLLQNKKLIVSSEEMLKRLMYMLKIYILRNISKLKEYYKKTSIEYYFTDISDFKYNTLEIVLKGRDAVLRWFNERYDRKVYSDKIDPSTRNPYFFCNNLVENGKLFLAQNGEDLQVLAMIYKQWTDPDNSYNSGYYEKSEFDMDKMTIYGYGDENNISKKVYGQADSDCIIIVSKNNINVLYTILLEF